MAGQTTVPFFSGSNFFQSYVSTIIGAHVKIQTPITTQKNYNPKKKGTVDWTAMFFKPPEKNTTRKKKGTVL